MKAAAPASGRHFIGGTIRVFLAEALLLPTGLITAAFLTRNLGVAGYGLFSLATALVWWAEWSLSSLFSRPTIKLAGEADDWRPLGTTVLRAHLWLGLAGGAVFWLLAPLVAAWLHEPELTRYLRLFAVDIPLTCVAYAYRNLLVGLGNYDARALGGAVRVLTRLALMVGLVWGGLSVDGAILGTMGATVAEGLVYRAYLHIPFTFPQRFPTRQLWDYALPLFLFAMSLRIYEKLDVILIKARGGTAELAGLYSAAQNLTVVPGLFVMAFAPLLLSTLTRALRAQRTAEAFATGQQMVRFSILLLPFAGMTAGAAPGIVRVIYGLAFSGAAPFLAILIFGSLALVVFNVTTSILIAAGHAGWPFALAAPMAVAGAAGVWAIIPVGGAVGASAVIASVSWLGAAASCLVVYRLWGIRPTLGTVARSLALCAAAFLVTETWPAPGLWLVLQLALICALIPVGYLVLGEVQPHEVAWGKAWWGDWRAGIRHKQVGA